MTMEREEIAEAERVFFDNIDRLAAGREDDKEQAKLLVSMGAGFLVAVQDIADALERISQDLRSLTERKP